MLASLSHEVKQYLVITGNYWAFTLTDGALRMLVVLHFHQLGYTPLAIALLFLFYEFFGVVTNLVGGWLGARIGLNKTMNLGLALQILALAMLAVPNDMLSVVWVMLAQALSGIAKDLNKMSAKSSIKLLVPQGDSSGLFKWVALLTGSKNALKGLGFFMGGGLMTLFGFTTAMISMATALAFIWLMSLILLKKDLGKTKQKPKFTQIFSKSPSINYLSAARMFLFGSRDVWFVVALPVFLATQMQWDHWQVGGFLALWVIGYGAIQIIAPSITGKRSNTVPDGRSALHWAIALAVIPAIIATLLALDVAPQYSLIPGLLIFGAVFALNSSLHSFLIVHYADSEAVSMDVGFYYMANAMGRLIGTLLSGFLFQAAGLGLCLWVSSLFLLLTVLISIKLPKYSSTLK